MRARRYGDVLGRLYVVYHETNERHFAGMLPMVPFRIQTASRPGKVQTIAYCVTDDYVGQPRCIVMDSRCQDGDWDWSEVVSTVKHEMIHVWQAVTGRPVDHGAEFKRMCKVLGINERAVD